MCMQLPTYYEITPDDITGLNIIATMITAAGPSHQSLSLSLPYTRETSAALFALARNFKTALDEVEKTRGEIANGTRGFKKGQA